jgi:hypothetical protein
VLVLESFPPISVSSNTIGGSWSMSSAPAVQPLHFACVSEPKFRPRVANFASTW